jgi:hypothetical protein
MFRINEVTPKSSFYDFNSEALYKFYFGKPSKNNNCGNYYPQMIEEFNYATHKDKINSFNNSYKKYFQKMDLFDVNEAFEGTSSLTSEEIDECHPLFEEAQLFNTIKNFKYFEERDDMSLNEMADREQQRRNYDTLQRSVFVPRKNDSDCESTDVIKSEVKNNDDNKSENLIQPLQELYNELVGGVLNKFLYLYGIMLFGEYAKVSSICRRVEKITKALNELNSYSNETIINDVNKEGKIYLNHNTKHKELFEQLNDLLTNVIAEDPNYLSKYYACNQIINYHAPLLELFKCMYTCKDTNVDERFIPRNVSGMGCYNPSRMNRAIKTFKTMDQVDELLNQFSDMRDLKHLNYENYGKIEYNLISSILNKLDKEPDERIKLSNYINFKCYLYKIAHNNLRKESVVSNIPRDHPLYGGVNIATSVRMDDNMIVYKNDLVNLLKFVAGTESIYNIMSPIFPKLNIVNMASRVLVRCILEHISILDADKSIQESKENINDDLDILIIHNPTPKINLGLKLNNMIDDINKECVTDANNNIKRIDSLSETGRSSIYEQLCLLYSYAHINDINKWVVDSNNMMINYQASFVNVISSNNCTFDANAVFINHKELCI